MLASLGPCPGRSSTQDSASDSPASADMCQCAHANLAQPSPTAATWPARLGRAVVPVLRRAGGGAGSGRARAPTPTWPPSNGARLRGSPAARAERATHCAPRPTPPRGDERPVAPQQTAAGREDLRAQPPGLDLHHSDTRYSVYDLVERSRRGIATGRRVDNDDPSGVCGAYLRGWPTSPRQGRQAHLAPFRMGGHAAGDDDLMEPVLRHRFE